MDYEDKLRELGIFINLDKHINCKTSPLSYFIKFNYNVKYVELIKSLPIRYWLPESRMWEIPERDIDDFYKLFFPEDEETLLKPYESKTPMFPHQIEALKYSIKHDSFINGGMPGVGKTKESLDAACYRKKYNGLKHCLIVCGVSNLRANWINEIKKHTNETCCLLGEPFRKPYKTCPNKFYPATIEDRLEHLKSVPEEFFWVCNQETLRCPHVGRGKKKRMAELDEKRKSLTEKEINKKYKGFDRLYLKGLVPQQILQDLYEKGELGLIIVDEFHELRNPANQCTETLLGLDYKLPKILLSGTPVVNSPYDLYVPLKLLGKEDRDYYTFKSYYTNYTLNFGKYLPDGTYKNLNQLQQKVDKFMIRQKKDVLDLPPKIHEEQILEMSDEERTIYDKVIHDMTEDLDLVINEGGSTTGLAMQIRLRQITSDIGVISTKCAKSTKFERLRQIIREHIANNEKLIIYSSFRKVIHRIPEYFQDDEIIKKYLDNFIIIEGGMDQDDLEMKKAKYQNAEGFACILGVTSALKAGHTLSACNTIVFIDLPFNRATMEQAEDRAHRVGTTHSVTIIPLLFQNTIDEVIYLTCMNRGYTADHIIDKKELKLYSCLKDMIKSNTYLEE